MNCRAKSFFFIFVLTSCFAFGSTPAQFNQIKYDISQELTSIQSTLIYLNSDITTAKQNLVDELSYWQGLASGDPNNDNGYQTALSAANSMYWNSYPYLTSVQSELSGMQTSVNRAQSLLASLSAPTNDAVDLQPVLDAIATNTWRITSSIDENSDNIIAWLDESISNNATRVIYSIDVCASNLVAIIAALQDLGGSSGGGGGSSTEVDFTDIINALTSIYNALTGFRADANSFYSWALANNSPFKKFFTTALSRLERPDSELDLYLNRMWTYTVDHTTEVLSNNYALTSQLSHVHIGDGDPKLSNEGLIALNQLAFDQRNYLCSVEMLKKLDSLSTTNNLSWITNYLATVQSHYYDLFNKTILVSTMSYSPFLSSNMQTYTNFLRVASTPGLNANLTYALYRRSNTNWFDRIETQLMTLNGLFPVAGFDTSDFESANDDENTTRHVEYSTNAIVSIVDSISSVSNSVKGVLTSFSEMITSFDLPEGASEGYFRIMPSFEFGGIQFEHIDLSWNDLEVYTDAIRIVFTALWYVIFGLISFRLVILVVWLFGKTVGHIVLIVSTLIS